MSSSQFAIHKEECEEGWEEDLDEDTSALAEFGKYQSQSTNSGRQLCPETSRNCSNSSYAIKSLVKNM
jgi:hypothetical protein